MFATGLALIFGVMKLVNIAHGDSSCSRLYRPVDRDAGRQSARRRSSRRAGHGGDRLCAASGALLNRTLGDDLLPPLLVTFGLSVIIQNGLLEIFTADSVKLDAGQVEIASIPVGGGLAVGVLPLIQLVLAVVIIAGLQWAVLPDGTGPRLPRHLRRSVGRATDGTEQRAHLRARHGAVAGHCRHRRRVARGARQLRSGHRAGAAHLRLRSRRHGRPRQHVGTLAGGIILGVAQTVGAQLDPGWNLLAGHIAFLVVLALKPEGLFPKVHG